MIILILMVAAVICLFAQAFQCNVKNIEIGWLGLAFWALAVTIPLLNFGGNALTVLLVVLLIIIVFLVLRRPRVV